MNDAISCKQNKNIIDENTTNNTKDSVVSNTNIEIKELSNECISPDKLNETQISNNSLIECSQTSLSELNKTNDENNSSKVNPNTDKANNVRIDKNNNPEICMIVDDDEEDKQEPLINAKTDS